MAWRHVTDAVRAGVQRLQFAKDLGDDLRRQSGGRLVEKKQRGSADQRARDRQHLPLAAGQGTGTPARLAGEVWKACRHLIDALAPVGAGQAVRRQFEVFGNRQAGKDVLGLRHEAQPAHHLFMHGQFLDRHALERDGP